MARKANTIEEDHDEDLEDEEEFDEIDEEDRFDEYEDDVDPDLVESNIW